QGLCFAPPKFDHLKRGSREGMGKIREETVRAACQQVRGRLEAVLRENGGHFEKL
ncbi:Hypothetical protein FKW44_013816, partial [Caligus rogercresseyi]